MRVRATLASPAATVSDVAMAQEQPAAGWHSPVPYLFGGLAAMLALIAIALLILACSYWKLSGHLNSGASDGNAGEREEVAEAASSGWESKVLVIMAGQVVPTFLASATPSTSRSSSFGDTSTTTGGSGCSESDDKRQKVIVEISGGGEPGSDAARVQGR